MREVVVELKRKGTVLRIESDLHGFYLCGTDAERVMGSIVPLIQHCLWRNENSLMMLVGELDHQNLIETGKTKLTFVSVEEMDEPTILVGGDWWVSPDGSRHVFVPSEEDQETLERIQRNVFKS